ncbi:MAG: acetylornithine transaminase [Proteobacteria bacterium]|nr:acetylornithine transaminase [Pseudomonadota bacterium]
MTSANTNTKHTPLMANYARADLAFKSGAGAWLIAEDDTRYLDCASGIGVTNLGHAHPHLVQALTTQAEKLWHVSNLYRIPEQTHLAGMLASRAGAGLDSVFFCNSGVEAVEGAVKIARRAQYSKSQKNPRHTIICFDGAFHGRTLAMLAATDRPDFREGFGPMPSGFQHLPFGNMNALRQVLLDDASSPTPKIAAIMYEAAQGEGGGRALPPQFLEDTRKLADETDTLLIADEVQIGMGRSGKLFSYQHTDITPDIVAIAKGLGGGFPIGAVITRSRHAQHMTPGSHGSTFGGNPLAMRAATAVLEVMDETFLADVRTRIKQFWQSMEALAKKHSAIRHIQGLGFLLAVVLDEGLPASQVIASMRDKKVLTVAAANNSIRFLPPLVITSEELRLAVATLDAALTETTPA